MARATVRAVSSSASASATQDRILEFKLSDGCAIIFGDCHFNGMAPPSTANRALVQLASELQPDALICTGDEADFASISRHPKLGWERRQTLAEEIATLQERMGEIVHAAPNASRWLTRGNHSDRWESWLANNAPELEGLPGMTFDALLPAWSVCRMLRVNTKARIPTLIKHRHTGSGARAAITNAAKAGTHLFVGHSHCLQAIPVTDFAGSRWSVDCGTLADVNSSLFAYAEKSQLWRSGFVVVHWVAGELQVPELAMVQREDPRPGHGLVSFRARATRLGSQQ